MGIRRLSAAKMEDSLRNSKISPSKEVRASAISLLVNIDLLIDNNNTNMHPELTEAFNDQRKGQQQLVRIALIQRDVNEARVATLKMMDTLITRGNDLEKIEEQSIALEESSRAFVKEAWSWTHCFPAWWCNCKNGKEGQKKATRRRGHVL